MSDSSLLPLQRTQQAAGRTEQRKLNKIFSLCNIALWRPNVEPKIPRPHWELISVFLLLSELYQKFLSSQYVFTIPNLWWCVSLRVYRNWRKRKESEVTQLCLTLCNPMDCSLPSSSVHGFFFQARVLEWVTISFSRWSSWPRDRTWVSCTAGRCFAIWAIREAYRN